MPGVLVLCSTPIGNLGDISDRLREALKQADVIYAEDTRRTATLLNAIGAKTPARSYFTGNEGARADELRTRLSDGETVALVTDAGTPAVSDPGVSAVRVAVAVGATVTVIPGPSAVTAALAVSGFNADRFVFEGFLPRRGAERELRLSAMGREDRTVVWFTTAPRIGADFEDLGRFAAPDRPVVVAREMTKLHEEVWRGGLSDAAGVWNAAARGEFTVVMDGALPQSATFEDALGEVRTLVDAGVSVKDATRQVADLMGVRRRDLYEAVTAGPAGQPPS
ncbi:MAG: 16S rRNA (cytidine(1402)-2'-O)-methyltransferase [Acidimicrobiia bacterium]|nr:16S rRNA (cytidine(1402)-2'-O)-methyltransferase [Acidimicrobiia bacterium]